MKNIVSIILAFCFVLGSLSASAGYQGQVKIKKMYGSTYISFGSSSQPSGTCDYFGRYFRFNATTPAGQNLLSILIAAELANRDVDIWYTESLQLGTGQISGCTQEKMAVVYGVSLSD